MNHLLPDHSARSQIHYWKCDRSSVGHVSNKSTSADTIEKIQSQLQHVLEKRYNQRIDTLQPAGGQGNHLTFQATINNQATFIRVNHGPERDSYMEVESSILDRVRQAGVPAPLLYGCDVNREEVPFAWQVLEKIPQADLNTLHRNGTLDLNSIMKQLGQLAAQWQSVKTSGYGPFSIHALRQHDHLVGYHDSYEKYFYLRLDNHMDFLEKHEFLPQATLIEIRETFEKHRPLTRLVRSCLVHKDLALWNLLGTQNKVTSVIDWDDAIAGDPMDDLSLLACFHDGSCMKAYLDGYTSTQKLPNEASMRFWLHLLRNMILKSVIRINCGYFHANADLFLLGSGQSGVDLKKTTHERIDRALQGLHHQLEMTALP